MLSLESNVKFEGKKVVKKELSTILLSTLFIICFAHINSKSGENLITLREKQVSSTKDIVSLSLMIISKKCVYSFPVVTFMN